MYPGQFILFMAVVIIGVWLILKHLRTKKFTQDYMEYKKKAIEKEVDTTNSDLIFFEHSKQAWSLRIALIAFSIGLTFILLIVLFTFLFPDFETDVKKLFITVGALLMALGIGAFFNWKLIDKPRQDEIRKKLEANIEQN